MRQMSLTDAWVEMLLQAAGYEYKTVVAGTGVSVLNQPITPQQIIQALEGVVDPALVHLYRNGYPGNPEDHTRYIHVNETRVPTVDCQIVDACLEQGTALLVEAVDQMFPEISKAAEAVEMKMPDHRVNVAALLSAIGGCEVYSPHFDLAHVLVYQVCGTKQWTFYEPREPSSNYKKLGARELGQATQTVTMLPGDVMFVPQYVPHHCKTLKDSMHLTADVSWFGATLFDWAEALKKAPVACAEMPWHQALKMVENSQPERDRVLGEMQYLRERNAAETKARRSQRLNKFRQRWST